MLKMKIFNLLKKNSKFIIIGGMDSIYKNEKPRDIDLLSLKSIKDTRSSVEEFFTSESVHYILIKSPYGLDQYFYWEFGEIFLLDILYLNRSMRIKGFYIQNLSIKHTEKINELHSHIVLYYVKNILKADICGEKERSYSKIKSSPFNLNKLKISKTKKILKVSNIENGDFIEYKFRPIYWLFDAVFTKIRLLLDVNIMNLICTSEKIEKYPNDNDQIDLRIISLNDKINKKFRQSRKLFGFEMPVSALKITVLYCPYLKNIFIGKKNIKSVLLYLIGRK